MKIVKNLQNLCSRRWLRPVCFRLSIGSMSPGFQPHQQQNPHHYLFPQKVPLEQLISQVRLFDHEDKVLLLVQFSTTLSLNLIGDRARQVMSNAPNPWKPIHDGLFLSLDSKNPPFLPKDPLDALQVP